VIGSTAPGAAGITAGYRFEITAASFFPLHSFAAAFSTVWRTIRFLNLCEGPIPMSLDSLQSLFVEELRDIYNGEKQLLKALPRMAKAAESAELKQAFTSHLKETEGHVRRIEQIFTGLGQAARGKQCKGIEGLIEEGKEKMEEDGEGSVIDAALIGAGQKVEHYEIAAYGCLRTYAQLLGHGQAVKLLEQTLAEEEAADKKLNELAEGGINEAAAATAQSGEE
jgi:ferritin-like metal-binding protein YciE